MCENMTAVLSGLRDVGASGEGRGGGVCPGSATRQLSIIVVEG